MQKAKYSRQDLQSRDRVLLVTPNRRYILQWTVTNSEGLRPLDNLAVAVLTACIPIILIFAPFDSDVMGSFRYVRYLRVFSGSLCSISSASPNLMTVRAAVLGSVVSEGVVDRLAPATYVSSVHKAGLQTF